MSKEIVIVMMAVEIDDTHGVNTALGENRELPMDLRQSILAALPRSDRMVAVMGETEARLMLAAHCLTVQEAQGMIREAVHVPPRGRRVH